MQKKEANRKIEMTLFTLMMLKALFITPESNNTL